jgi:hypothetical protein
MFPQWIPGTTAALFHGNFQVTTNVPDYIRTAKHTPNMKAYLIERSHTASGRDSSWTSDIFDNIAWQPIGANLRQLSIGQRIQISKYMNDLLPTAKRLQTFDNKHDGRCFECQQLWEDTNHILQCPGEDRSNQRKESMINLREQLTARKTPNVMTDIICDNMENWIHRRRQSIPTWTQNETFLNALNDAFYSQKRIGWDQFFRGRLSQDWATAIGIYYKERRPGTAYTPDYWMRHMINAVWNFSMNLWRQRCASYHGVNSLHTLERKRKSTAQKAKDMYQQTIDKVSTLEAIILHRHKLTEIMNWTKQHLDAYLATAEVICEWNVEPG